MSGNEAVQLDGPETDMDSDPVEEVDSEEEFSRVIATPYVVKGNNPREEGNSSTPKIKRNQSRCADNVPLSPLDNNIGTPSYPKLDTQQTQQVAPLTASQMKELMGGLMEGDIIESSSSDTENGLIEKGSDPADSSNAADFQWEIPPDELTKDDLTECTFSRDDPDTTPHGLSLEIIEETPLKIMDYGDSYVSLLVFWEANSGWWPCQARKSDWENRSRKANVTFRDGVVSEVDLSEQAELFTVNIDDHVRIVNEKGLFRVENVYTSSILSIIKTSNGFNTVDLTCAKKLWPKVPMEDVYFLPKDRDNNTQKSLEGSTAGSSSRKTQLGNNERPRTPNKKVKRVEIETPSPLKISPKNISPAEDNSVNSNLTKPSPRRNLKKYKLAHRTHSSPSFSSSVNETKSSIFKTCLFSISTISEVSSNEDSAEKWRCELEALIEFHGGRVLKNGLADVVKFTDKSDLDGWIPQLESNFSAATFMAVLTDRPKRTMKYLEMRALGWPCLHYKYIEDCVKQKQLIEWLAYQLPAGEISLPGRSMMVNSDVAAFHSRWALNMSLDGQLLRRRVILNSTVPICVVKSVRDEPEVLLLTVLSAAHCGIWVYSDQSTLPEGSIILDLNLEDSPKHIYTDPETLYHIRNYAALNSSLKKCKEWLIQCIINGSPV